MVELKNLSKFYNTEGNMAIGLQNINLKFKKGEFIAIVGASGSGKTTLLNVVSGMDTYEEGEMIINGISTSDYTKEDFEDFRRSNVAFIFQNYQLIDSYTVLENVMVELIFKGDSLKNAKSKAKDILKKVGLSKRLHNRATKLSGGEKQRCVIARALASNAPIIACDEPTGNLDSKNSIEVIKLLKEVAPDKLILFVTHDESIISDVATRIIRIKDGQVEQDMVITDVVEEKMHLNEPNKNRMKTKIYIALKNILRTPKKTFFILLVFLVLSIEIMSSITSIDLNVDDLSSTESVSVFENDNYNRVIVYGNDLDLSDKKANMVLKNDFYLDESFYVRSDDFEFGRTIIDPDYQGTEIKAGRLPETENEILLIFPYTNSDMFYSKYLEKKIGLISYYDDVYIDDDYQIVGFAEYSQSYFATQSMGAYFTQEGLKKFRNRIIEKNLDNEFSVKMEGIVLENFTSEMDYYATVGKKGIARKINAEITDSEAIYINEIYKNANIQLFLGREEINLSEYKIIYLPFENTATVYLPSLIKEKIYDETPYRYSLYYSNDNIDDGVELLEKNGLEYYAIKDLEIEYTMPNYVNIILLIFLAFLLIIEVSVAILITNLITSFILGTKKKELGILRVIGLTRKDTFHVLCLELEINMLGATLIILFYAGLCKLTEIPFDLSYIYERPLQLVFSLGILFVMTFVLATKWNKKMFKKTAREILRAGETL